MYFPPNKDLRVGFVSISPVDSSLFVNELKQRCPQAEFSGL
jgi:hypothetical protein